MKWLQKYGFPEDIRLEALRQIRILWAYESTGIEGNTLDFGDTKLVMEEGITIGGKTLREHNEVVGHGRVTGAGRRVGAVETGMENVCAGQSGAGEQQDHRGNPAHRAKKRTGTTSRGSRYRTRSRFLNTLAESRRTAGATTDTACVGGTP